MTDRAWTEGLKNWGNGPATGRPTSVGPSNITENQTDPNNKGLDPDKDFPGKPGDNKGLGVADAPGGPVNIPVKNKD
jgi:hypothetical protein